MHLIQPEEWFVPRATEEKARIEAERLALLHQEQGKARRRLQHETKVKKKSNLPGEELLKKNLAIYLKVGVPNISYNEIADRIGETRKTVKNWFKSDPLVREQYEFTLDNLREGAHKYMQTYSLEAVETLALLMRMGSEKYMFESAISILDRVGVPKVERFENQNENISKHQWADRSALVEEIRKLSPEQQEEAIEVIEKLESLLSGQFVTDDDENEDSNELDPIINSEDDPEDTIADDDEDE